MASRPAIPMLDDAGRSPNPSICPFLRSDAAGVLGVPVPAPAAGNTCIAIGQPRSQSAQQQELVCLRPAHGDCPRYLRGVVAPTTPPRGRSLSSIPKATVAALAILLVSAALSVGFVVQRGGLEMSAAGGPGASEVAMATADLSETEPPESLPPESEPDLP